jgi:MerR family transcriptional regulator, thiopeptide resistance regulator
MTGTARTPAATEPATEAMTVGQVAHRLGLTVRTLHHYDEIGLLVPSGRSGAGYRLYAEDDITRLQHVVVYRRLGFALEEIAFLLDDPAADVADHLRRQRAAVTSRLEEMRDLVTAIDRALEQQMSGSRLTRQEQRELFGEGFSDDYAQEAERRWGDREVWAQSRARTARYTKEDWLQVRAEAEASGEAFAAALRDGVPADSDVAMDLAEQARDHIVRWFYDCSHEIHRGLAQLYLDDPRFRRGYDDRAPGLARYVHDAIVANCARHGVGAPD